MALDPYAPCKCGSGKKLKFCCAGLSAEFEKIERMLAGEQRHACLQYVEELCRKHPNSAGLVTTRVRLLVELQQLDQAAELLEALLRTQPNNPVALAEMVVLDLLRQGDLPISRDRLEQALAAAGEPWPERVVEVARIMSSVLFQEGHYFAGRALLEVIAGGPIDTQGDPELASAVYSAELPVLWRDDWPLEPAPPGAPFEEAFSAALALAKRGRFRAALEQFAELAVQVGEVPAVVKNLGVLRLYLAEEASAAELLHHYARLEVPFEEAVRTEALAQSLEVLVRGLGSFDLVQYTHTLCDYRAAVERLLSDRRTATVEVEAMEFEEDQPRPSHVMLLLDRPMASEDAELTVETVPRQIGMVGVYGRQTDREARLELRSMRHVHLDQAAALLKEICGDALAAEPPDETVLERVQRDSALTDQVYLGSQAMDFDRRVALHDELERQYLLHRWPELRLVELGDRTPQEAAADPQGQVPLAAAILNLELGHDAWEQRDLFEQLRRRLGVDRPAPPDAAAVNVDCLSLAQIPRLALDQLSDTQLTALFRFVLTRRYQAALKATIRAIAGRPSLREQFPPQQLYAVLALLEGASSAALEAIELGRRAEQEAGGEALADWDFRELELRVQRNEPEEFTRLLEHITTAHAGKLGVQQRLFRLLRELGLVGPDGRPAHSAGDQAAGAEAEPESPGLWTPDQPQPTQQKATSGLWLPGQE